MNRSDYSAGNLCVCLNRCFDLLDESCNVTPAVFVGEVCERDRWRIVLATLAHPVGGQHVKGDWVGREKIPHRGVTVDV